MQHTTAEAAPIEQTGQRSAPHVALLLGAEGEVLAPGGVTLEADGQPACRLALARRLLLRKAITPAPTGRVTAWATKH